MFFLFINLINFSVKLNYCELCDHRMSPSVGPKISLTSLLCLKKTRTRPRRPRGINTSQMCDSLHPRSVWKFLFWAFAISRKIYQGIVVAKFLYGKHYLFFVIRQKTSIFKKMVSALSFIYIYIYIFFFIEMITLSMDHGFSIENIDIALKF